MKPRTARGRLFLPAFALLLFTWYGCSESTSVSGPQDAAPVLNSVPTPPTQGAIDAAINAQEAATSDLMRLDDVVGTGVGIGADGNPTVQVFLKTGASSIAGIPSSVSGISVETVVTGEIFALGVLPVQDAPDQDIQRGPPPGKGKNKDVDRRARVRPAPLGMSTGHPSITACTIGARLIRGGVLLALSNNHCYAASNAASIGDAVIQPGRADGGSSPADDIGTLDDFQVIDFAPGANNVIDAAVAVVTAADVTNSTTSGCYGTPKSTTMAAALTMELQKCGRTTGYTTGTVTAINATVNVNYGAPGVARFVGQIITTNMSGGGDSGSLVVAKAKGKNKADNLKPVGLLYAGNSTVTIMNPIDAVLTRFGATVDGS